ESNTKIRNAREKLIMTLGREPYLSELSAETNLSSEEIAQAEYATGTADSLNRITGDEGYTLEEILGTQGIEENVVESVTLSDAIKKLPERERMIILLRYYKCLTQDKTAKILKISQVQVSRLERSAISKLRELI
ncbi:MAG: sigma-70 family RNA polymerase sigma factor, partial [Clostridiales bacterium]|nr:sigma-70 family RNA polymerase sigma factor [Clostridiales bacterium]